MARSEARLQFGIWQQGLRGHSRDAKLLYAVLLTEPTVNHAGVGAVRIERWSDEASMTMEEVQEALVELGKEPQVVVDYSTHEVLVRSMIRNDGVADQPYVLKGALKDALRTVSPTLRRVLASELRRLPPKRPDGVSKSGKPVVYPDPHAVADQLDPSDPRPYRHPSERVSEPSPVAPETTLDAPEPKGSGKGFETLGGGGRGGGGGSSPVATHLQQSKTWAAQTASPTPPAPEPQPTTTPPRERGGRIPDDFTVTPDMIEWARQHAPHVDGRRETAAFIDHWKAKTGREATKLDWPATWRNWMRKEETWATSRSRNGRHRPSTDDNIRQILAGTGTDGASHLIALPGRDDLCLD